MLAVVVAAVASLFDQARAAAVRPEPDRSPLVIIASDSVQLTNISLDELRHVFEQRRMYAPNGTAILPINAAPRSRERELFDRIVLGRSPDEAGRFWIDQKIRGRALPPRSVASRELVVKMVQNLPGAISYVPQNSVQPGMRVLSIDGYVPGDPKYPLAHPEDEAAKGSQNQKRLP